MTANEQKRADKIRPGDRVTLESSSTMDGLTGLVAVSRKHPKKGQWWIDFAGPFPEGVGGVSFSCPKNQMFNVETS